MTANEKFQVADKTKLSDLTVGEFKTLVREIVADVVEQAVFELEQQLPDPDEGKELRPGFVKELQQALSEEDELLSYEDVVKELGLDE